MKCRKCGHSIPPGDKHCVYCGAPTGPLPLRVALGLSGRLPPWAKWLSVSVTVIGIVALVVTSVLKSDGFTPLLFQLKELADTTMSLVTVNSKYATSLPVIDGILEPGEWTEPTFTKSFDYQVGNVSKTGEMVGCFMNSEKYLYCAVVVSAEDFKKENFKKNKMEDAGFFLYLHFDNNNDGIIEKGEDIKVIEILMGGRTPPWYNDDYADPDKNWPQSDWGGGDSAYMNAKRNGLGSASYSDSTGCLTYEFSIPLNDGDPLDLSAKPGDTIGIKVRLEERNYGGVFIGWPIGRGVNMGSTYAKLTLATSEG